MSTNLQARIAAIKAKCEEMLRLSAKATAGPWFSNGRYIGTRFHKSYVGEARDENGNWCNTEKSNSDASFIAHARNVSPAMARVVLGTLAEAEKMKDMEGGDMWLESIANQWEGK